MAGVYRPRHPETKPEAERVGKYMLRPVLALERLTFLEPGGKVDPMLCPKCGGRMKVIAFLTDFSVVDRSSPGVIDTFSALIYASVRWRDGIIDVITRLQTAQQKTKYLWRGMISRGVFECQIWLKPSGKREPWEQKI